MKPQLVYNLHSSAERNTHAHKLILHSTSVLKTRCSPLIVNANTCLSCLSRMFGEIKLSIEEFMNAKTLKRPWLSQSVFQCKGDSWLPTVCSFWSQARSRVSAIHVEPGSKPTVYWDCHVGMFSTNLSRHFKGLPQKSGWCDSNHRHDIKNDALWVLSTQVPNKPWIHVEKTPPLMTNTNLSNNNVSYQII